MILHEPLGGCNLKELSNITRSDMILFAQEPDKTETRDFNCSLSVAVVSSSLHVFPVVFISASIVFLYHE